MVKPLTSPVEGAHPESKVSSLWSLVEETADENTTGGPFALLNSEETYLSINVVDASVCG